MGNINLIFHIVSLFVFLALLVGCANSLRYRKYISRMIRASGASGDRIIVLDWPQNFIRIWCEFLEIPCTVPKIRHNDVPKKIRPGIWFDFFRKYGINGIRWTDQSPQVIVIDVSLPVDESEFWKRQLIDIFNTESLTIEFQVI